MERKETEKVLGLLAANYPVSFANLSQDALDDMNKLWTDAFATIPAELVRKAVTAIILTDTRDFAPKIAHVMNKLVELISNDPETDAAEAWETVRSFIQRHPQEQYKDFYYTLPDGVRRVFGVSDLIAIANNPVDQNQNFVRPNFIKTYKAIRSDMTVKAIQSGNLELIANPAKLAALTGGPMMIDE